MNYLQHSEGRSEQFSALYQKLNCLRFRKQFIREFHTDLGAVYTCTIVFPNQADKTSLTQILSCHRISSYGVLAIVFLATQRILPQVLWLLVQPLKCPEIDKGVN